MLTVSSYSFCFLVPCGRLSWLFVSFLACVNIVYRVVSYHDIVMVTEKLRLMLPFTALTLLLGDRKGIPPVKRPVLLMCVGSRRMRKTKGTG